MTPNAPPKIVIRGLSTSFRDPRRSRRAHLNGDGGDEVHVLSDVNLTVGEGEFVCIVGPSGCGKSTLLNIVAGFIKARRGEVFIDGSPVAAPDPRRVFIFQENGIFPWLTVEQNIGFGLTNASPAERRETVAHYVRVVGLNGFEGAYPHALSGGMKQRVEIARALAANPDVLYMDEPFGALDFLTRLRMRAELVEIWQREKKTVLFVTHDVDESVQLADRVVVMSQRPAAVADIVSVDLPRPRDTDAPELLRARERIFEVMGFAQAGGGRAPSAPEDDRSPDAPEEGESPAVAPASRAAASSASRMAAVAPPRRGLTRLWRQLVCAFSQGASD